MTESRTETAPAEAAVGRPLRVAVAAGTGEGVNALSAFDAALAEIGLAQYNLIRLSSMIPAATEVRRVDGPIAPAGEWGDRLYVVMADASRRDPGESAVVGIGWAQRVDTGAGFFVEHAGSSRDEVERDIDASLEDLSTRRGGDWLAPGRCVAEVPCERVPVAAVAVAVFGCEGWESVRTAPGELSL